jgi:hypothetical protein
MTGSRNGVVRVGDEIRLRSQVFTVVTLSGVSVRLIDAMGARTDVPLPQLLPVAGGAGGDAAGAEFDGAVAGCSR